MFKNSIKFSIVAVATLMITGCNKSSDSRQDNTPLQEVSQELKILVKSTREVDESFNKIPSPTQTANGSPLAQETKSCTNGGTMDFASDFNQTAIMESPNDFNITMRSKAIDCVEWGMIINGEIETIINMKNQKNIMTMTYLSDFNITDGATEYIIKKDSTIVSEDINETSSINISNMVIVTSKETYKSVDLKSIETEFSDGSSSSYSVSGKEIVNGKAFIVDESYDAKLTPINEDKDGNILKGAKAKYTNDQNHSITIESIERNEIQISVDIDGDGKSDQVEVISL